MTDRQATRAIAAICGQPWAITKEALERVLAIAERTQVPSLEVLEAQTGRRLAHTRSVTMRGETAVIPVTGPLFRYANLFCDISGATAFSDLAGDFNAALKDPAVKTILLQIDSPGGELSGTEEMAKLILGARGRKRVLAHVDGLMCSGAYWIGSAADRIVANETSMIGSIGVVIQVEDRTGADTARGVLRYEFVSAQSPLKRTKPGSDEERSQLQGLADQMGDVFVSAVARHRGVSTDTVLSRFGQGGLFAGREALRAGMIDEIATFEEVVARLSAGATARSSQPVVRQPTPQQVAEANAGRLIAVFDHATGRSSEEPPSGLPSATTSAPTPPVADDDAEARRLIALFDGSSDPSASDPEAQRLNALMDRCYGPAPQRRRS